MGTITLAACSGGVGSMLGSKPSGPSTRRMHLDIVQQGSGGSPRPFSPATTTAGPEGSNVAVSDGLFNGYDSSGRFFAQIDTSTEDANGMPIMKVVTGNGTTATVTFPDLSTLTAGTPWAFTFQGQSYQLLASTSADGDVQLIASDGSRTSVSSVNGDRTLTDPHGKQFTLPGTEIDRIVTSVYAPGPSPAPSAMPTALPSTGPMFTRRGILQAAPAPAPSATTPACSPAMHAKCERLRDAIFLLYYLALAAIALIGIGCIIGAWFAAGICTIAVAVALALATAQLLRSVRLFNFGFCGKVCHVYA